MTDSYYLLPILSFVVFLALSAKESNRIGSLCWIAMAIVYPALCAMASYTGDPTFYLVAFLAFIPAFGIRNKFAGQKRNP